jgi:hypothetical protein
MKTHPLSVSYLVMGLVFLGAAGSWALRESGVIDLGEARWLLPLTLIVAGVIGLAAFAAKGLRTNRLGTKGTSAADGTRRDGYDTGYSHYDTSSDSSREGDLR